MTNLITSSVHENYKLGTQHVLNLQFSCTEYDNAMNNLSSYFGLVDARISVSEKDLPVVEFVSCMQRGGGVSFHNRN